MASTALRTRLLIVLGYAAFFMFFFVMFAYWMFPYDRLRDYAVQQMAKREAKKGTMQDRYELEIGELGPAFLFGVTAQNVTLTKHPAGTDAAPVPMVIDEVELHPSLLALAGSSVDVDVDLIAGGGSLSGNYRVNPELTEIDLELEDLDLRRLGLGGYLGMPMTGSASGVVDVSLPAEAAASSGEINLKVRGTTIGNGKAKIKVPGMRDGFTLEKLDAGELTVDVEISEGNANIQQISADGKDLVLDGSGNIRIGSPFTRSRLNLTLELKFNEEYKNRDAKTKALFELMSFRPELKRATTPTGSLRFQITGAVAAPRGRPAGKTGPKPKAKRRPKPKKKKK